MENRLKSIEKTKFLENCERLNGVQFDTAYRALKGGSVGLYAQPVEISSRHGLREFEVRLGLTKRERELSIPAVDPLYSPLFCTIVADPITDEANVHAEWLPNNINIQALRKQISERHEDLKEFKLIDDALEGLAKETSEDVMLTLSHRIKISSLKGSYELSLVLKRLLRAGLTAKQILMTNHPGSSWVRNHGCPALVDAMRLAGMEATDMLCLLSGVMNEMFSNSDDLNDWYIAGHLLRAFKKEEIPSILFESGWSTGRIKAAIDGPRPE